ncbi:hypothetical protein COB52_04800, partial [Candidatus Kaiserbacteria bacterium]
MTPAYAETDYFDNRTAHKDAQMAIDNFDSARDNLVDGYDNLRSRLNANLADEEVFADPLVGRVGELTDRRMRELGRDDLVGKSSREMYGAVSSTEAQENKFWQRYDEMRAGDPEAFADMPDSREAFMAEIQAKAAATEATAAEVASRATGWGKVGAFVGTMEGAMMDTPNIASLLVGAPARMGILGTMAVEGGINAGTEAFLQKSVQDYRDALGLEHGFSQGLKNVAMAGAGGVTITGGMWAIGKGFKGGYGAIETAIGRRMSVAERAAVDHGLREAELLRDNPVANADPIVAND